MNFFTKRIFKRHLDDRIPFYPLQLLYILSKNPRMIRRIIVDCLDDFRVDVSILWMSISIFRTTPILPVLFMFIKPTISAWDFSLNSKLRINIWIGFKQTHVSILVFLTWKIIFIYIFKLKCWHSNVLFQMDCFKISCFDF